MKFKIIVCINKKNYIGKDNGLICYLPSDLKRFKYLTTNNVVIMGRKTFESLPNGALPNRVNIVLTSDKNFKSDNVIVCHSIDECIKLCEFNYQDKICYVIGGGSIYKSFLEKNVVDVVDVTYALNDIEGDVLFPKLSEDKWQRINVKRQYFDSRDECEYEIHKFFIKSD
jgi:dihydrofolate reductase